MSRLRILVVDDDPANREVAEVILRAAGHTVTLVGDGSDAVRLCIEEGQLFDLVVMDIAMPVMDGEEATRRLKSHPRTRHIPVLCCSAKASHANQDDGVEAGCDHYLTKPFRRAQLLEAVEETLARAGKRSNA